MTGMPVIFQVSSANHLRLKGKKRKYSLEKYPCQEMRLFVPPGLREGKAVIIGSVLPDANSLLELAVLADNIRTRGAEPSLIIPYLSYARQDKPQKGEPFAARVVCRMLKSAGFKSIHIIDCHNPKLRRFMKFENHIPLEMFAKELKSVKDPVVAVAPDKGAAKRAHDLAGILGIKTIYIRKRRLGPGKVKVVSLKGDVRGKNVIMFDDMIDTGGTLLGDTASLKEHGAKDIYVAATHGIFSGDAIRRLEKSPIKKIMVTNTLQNSIKSEKGIKSKKIKTLRIEPFIEKIISSEKKRRKTTKGTAKG